MPTYQLQIKQVVDYPRCRIYRQFVRFLMEDRNIRVSGGSGLFVASRLNKTPGSTRGKWRSLGKRKSKKYRWSYKGKRKVRRFWKEGGDFRKKFPSRRMLWNTKENWFTSCSASDAMIFFSTPSRGQQVLTPLGSAQTTSLLVVMIFLWFFNIVLLKLTTKFFWCLLYVIVRTAGLRLNRSS